MNKKTVLFVSHEASRTGAPIILLNLLEWLKRNSDLKFNLLINNNDSHRSTIMGDFEKLCDVLLYMHNPPLRSVGPITHALNHYASQIFTIKSHHRSLKKKLETMDIGLVYSNTIINSKVLDFLSYLNCPVITHVHELDYSISYMISSEDLNLIKKYTTRYIAVSKAVKNCLVNNHGISDDLIEMVYGFTPVQQNRAKLMGKSRKSILEELKIPDNAFIVGASGTTEWRKGPDIFIQLAHFVHKRKPEVPVHFIWIGGDTEGIQYINLSYDVKKSGLEEYIHFLGSYTNPFDYFNIFDTFALVSREDPFPLVMLENASLGKPILCFDNAGGAAEFVQDDSGFVVPYLDIEAMADKVLQLYRNNELRKKLGQNGAYKVEKQHNLETNAKKVLDLIQRTI